MRRQGCSIVAPAYDDSSESHKTAVVKAFCFQNSGELNSAICSVDGLSPYNVSAIESTGLSPDMGLQFAIFSDIASYASMSLYPDGLPTPEGDTFFTVMDEFMHGDVEWKDAIADLNERRNAAYLKLKEGGDDGLSGCAYTYDISR